jgi:hypothetical protein
LTPQQELLIYSSPPQLRYPQLRYFRSYAILNWDKKTRVKLFPSKLRYFFSPVTLFSSFSPQLRYLLCFRGKNSVTGGENTKIAQDIYYIKQTPRYAIFAATLFSNSTGHLLHKTNPNLSYFELSYVFWEPNYSVGRGTTVIKKCCTLKSISYNFNSKLPLLQGSNPVYVHGNQIFNFNQTVDGQ